MQIHHISDHGLYLFISVKGKNKIRNMLRLHSTLKLENIDYKLRLKNAVTNILVESDP